MKVVMTSLWVIKTICVRDIGSLKRHRTPGGLATAPCPPHTAALRLGVPGESTDAAANFGEQGVSKGVLPGTGCSVPGLGAHLHEGRGFQHFWRRFPPGDFFVFSVSGFPLYGRLLSGMKYYHPPSEIHSPYFWLSGRALDPVRKGPWFELNLLSLFFFCDDCIIWALV